MHLGRIRVGHEIVAVSVKLNALGYESRGIHEHVVYHRKHGLILSEAVVIPVKLSCKSEVTRRTVAGDAVSVTANADTPSVASVRA